MSKTTTITSIKKDDDMHEEKEPEDKEVNPDALDAALGDSEGFGDDHENFHPVIEGEEEAWRADAPEMQNFDDEKSW